MSARFAGKVVLLTGAAGGFGRRAALRLAGEGAALVLSDLREEPLAGVVQEVEATGARVAALAGDVAAETLHEGLVRLAVDRFGGLDVAINNAGIAHPYLKLADVPSDMARTVIAVDLMGVFLALKHQLPALVARGGGTVVNVASAAGLAGAPLLSAYAAAKHGVVGLTRTAAVEYARRNIRVNAVCPSFAATPMVTDELAAMRDGPEAALQRVVAAVPMRRLATVDEVVDAMLFLAGPESGFVTGQALGVDGGLTAQ
jgi:NAD(P)-dependent dehydrogenase (short-subunit alcohol dehydrogenase family)